MYYVYTSTLCNSILVVVPTVSRRNDQELFFRSLRSSPIDGGATATSNTNSTLRGPEKIGSSHPTLSGGSTSGGTEDGEGGDWQARMSISSSAMTITVLESCSDTVRMLRVFRVPREKK